MTHRPYVDLFRPGSRHGVYKPGWQDGLQHCDRLLRAFGVGLAHQGRLNQWPLYTVPADLLTIDLGRVYPELAGKRVRGKLEGKRVVPYDSRAAIEASGRRPPAIVYVDDPVDNFFLQVQGSGRVQLPDGKTIRLAYADHNGHPYVSIGKWLADKGEMPIWRRRRCKISVLGPSAIPIAQEMLNANPALVFFQEEPVTSILKSALRVRMASL
jgi:membrane-bound lytic murein transglycosylase A